jgi:hypothetical protein
MKCLREKKRWEAEAQRLLGLFLNTGERRHLTAYMRHRRGMDVAALKQLITKLAERRFR